MNRRMLALLALAAGCYGAPPGANDDPNAAPECQLDTQSEKTPGYPFDVARFTSDVLPVVAAKCGASGCHGAPAGAGNFTVWASATAGTCDFGKTFNNVVRKIDLTTPANSPLLAAINGGAAGHPLTLAADAPELATLRGFIDTAAATLAADGAGGVTPPPGASPFDYAIYQAQIQPAFDGAGCAAQGCHGSGAGGFKLVPTPAAASPDMQANFIAVTSRANLDDPAASIIYVRSTVAHAGGASTVLGPTEAGQLLAWITAAKGAGGNGTGNPSCASPALFNLGVFRSEVLPILSGDIDLNTATGQGTGAGCMSTACHGSDRGPGTLTLSPTADAATQLQNFACFVNLQAPSTSEILACPLGDPRCRRYPHPGQDVLGGANDLNYQRLLGFIYGAKADVSPLDFAFYVRKVNPIFDDVNAVEDGAQGRTCADSACHGVSVAGQPAPNGSDFPLIPNASDSSRLAFNFVSATGFANFLNPGESSLFLYPTNEIADRANHPFATGLPHPGGLDFEVDDAEALTILQWAAGLRPDAAGFQRNWLVVGDFPATQIADPTIVDEATVVPKIFDKGGGAFNLGEWDGLFADTGEVDLNRAFPRTATSGRAAYAVAYLLNTQPRAQLAQLAIATTNPARVYVDGKLVAQNDQGGGVSAIVSLPPAGTAPAPRVMIKLLQRATDARFAFSARLTDELGNLLTDRDGGIVVTLGPNGGI